MIELTAGHVFQLDNLKADGHTILQFYMDPHLHKGVGHSGPSTQEVLRACIARVKELHRESPAPENEAIIAGLRQAIMGFELRALRRKMEKDPEGVEALTTNRDGHVFTLVEDLDHP